MKRTLFERTTALAAAAALTLGLSACGGDEDSPATAPTSTVDPATQGYLDAVAPICDSTQADLQAISDGFTKEPTEAQFAAALEQATELILGQVEQIRDVEAPAALAEPVTQWLDTLEKAASGLPEFTIADADRGLDVFAESDPLARALGLGSCTSSGE